ncbi:DUF2996 domain-containing protein [Umezakia ovalisporum]|jgi:hypothetical protein|uniref:DUF2996 domain-containing protein n=1 Tax=Umezakia ovalisporum TaxID=75695 RepID=UPI0006F07E71|nr:DUF2996 domain-containing protein [Umezakia ovalisporum]MBI1240493.1 DUF2996 domain-containing protein [Nostoc sp. RI_552]MDH6086431.1 DUF2996 domain-containing protein [Umezakia ovalisporum TAC611]MDH6087018.1 DUF2996 domain-containing protein [Umezakia ovalisporum Ak1311]CEJ42449.1 Uncharacterized protein apha_00245 [Umezakia ovalisporum]
MAEKKNHNEAGEVAPSTVDKQAPTVAEENAPSTDEPVATTIPTANTPDPKAANPKVNPNAATAETAPPKEKKPPAAKKEKPPAVEDKPFVEFMQQDYLPSLQTAIAQQGVPDLQLSFAKQKVPIVGFHSAEECWQVIGSWQNGQRQFNLYFPDENITGRKGFSCNEGRKPSTLESFLIDERKITLDLLVFGLVQRLNSQKWLGRN